MRAVVSERDAADEPRCVVVVGERSIEARGTCAMAIVQLLVHQDAVNLPLIGRLLFEFSRDKIHLSIQESQPPIRWPGFLRWIEARA